MKDYFIVYGLTIISIIITSLAQFFISNSYSKYKKIKNERNITGAYAARYILDKHNLNDIKVVETRGYLTDHYDPVNKVIRLSSDIYHGASIASISVACHECGHAIQDKEKYLFLRIRSKLIPVVNFSSYAGYFAVVLGCIFGSLNLIWLGIIAEMVILLFQLITLPIEINASKKALKELDYSHFLNSNELKQGKIMLTAAALTYIASIATALIQILRLILMYGRRED